MCKLCDRAFEFDLENALHIIGLSNVPRIAACRLSHRQQKVFVEVGTNPNCRSADTPMVQTQSLRNNRVCTRDPNVGQAVCDQDNAVDSLIEQLLTNGESASNPGLL